MKNIMLRKEEGYKPAYECEGVFENVSRMDAAKGERVRERGRESVRVVFLTRNEEMIDTNVNFG